MKSANSSKWFAAMEDEMKSMSINKVWDLEEIPKVAKKSRLKVGLQNEV